MYINFHSFPSAKPSCNVTARFQLNKIVGAKRILIHLLASFIMRVNKTDVGKRKKHRCLVRITNLPSGKRAAALELSVIYHRINRVSTSFHL